MTERYLIFAGSNADLKGGWHDFLTEVPDLDTAQEVVFEHLKRDDTFFHWFHVVDLEHLQIVKILGRRVDTSADTLERRDSNAL
ncbi:MAG: hypothetical protein KAJ19_22860 [Gammaproteobacteria bacterium]|nr:hypothetical protein [Gammaproteobacteria bacterium]